MGQAEKFWDGLSAVSSVIATTGRREPILDAGGEWYSPILPWLARYGYSDLTACNLVFTKPWRSGPIRYEPGDITGTRYADGQFAAITCMSVIEHGVNPKDFFAETSRILKPTGVLVVSTDYWPERVDTTEARMCDAPYSIWSREDILRLVELAEAERLRLIDPLVLDASEPVIRLQGYEYTFILVTFVKA